MEAQTLANLFPSSSTVKRSPSAFDPSTECVALPQQKKKKKSQPKPATIEVFLLPSNQVAVPTGSLRKSFRSNGRCMKISLHRGMGAQEVRNSIIRAFHKIAGSSNYVILECEGNKLKPSNSQDLTGASAIDRRGALYLHENTVREAVN